MAREQKKLKGAHLSLLHQRQNMKGNDLTIQMTQVNHAF